MNNENTDPLYGIGMSLGTDVGEHGIECQVIEVSPSSGNDGEHEYRLRLNPDKVAEYNIGATTVWRGEHELYEL